jgi:hypothetical protein
MRRLLAVAAAAAISCTFAAADGSAHQSGCHSAHSCPSDHHSYVWFDQAGNGWDCVQPGADEYDPSRDTTTITYDGRTYYCRAAGSTAPPPPPLDSDGDGVPDSSDACPTVPAATATGCPATPPPPPPANPCDDTRSAIAVLADDDASNVSSRVKSTTVDRLRKLKRPSINDESGRVAGVETTTYKLHVRLVSSASTDSGIEIVVADVKSRRHTMIVVLPNDSCSEGTSSSARKRMHSARAHFVKTCGAATSTTKRLRGTATLSGVGFWADKDRRTGRAPNAIELAPVLTFAGKNCSP